MTFDPYTIRSDFPILSRMVNGKPLVYLDSAASAQKPKQVIAAMTHFAETSYANVHRGLHTLANEATAVYEGARARIAQFINAKSADEIVFTKGATEALNLLAHGLGADMKAGDEIILSVAEHHANLVPWHMLRAKLVWLPVGEDGRIEPTTVAAAITPRTRVIALHHISNVLGIAQDVAAICAIARAAGVISVIDGCQGVVHTPVDVQAMDCDAYVASGHKLYGPTGIGFLYGRAALLDRLPPYQGGGEMIERVTLDEVRYAAPPLRFEAGTPPIVEAVGLHAALDYIDGLDRTAVAAHESRLTAQFRMGLKNLGGRVLGTAGQGSITSFTLPGAHPHDLAQILDQYGVAIRAGLHCAEPLHTALGITGSARVSLGMYTTADEIEQCLKALHKAKTMVTV